MDFIILCFAGMGIVAIIAGCASGIYSLFEWVDNLKNLPDRVQSLEEVVLYANRRIKKSPFERCKKNTGSNK